MFMVKYGKFVGKHTIHGSYGNMALFRKQNQSTKLFNSVLLPLKICAGQVKLHPGTLKLVVSFAKSVAEFSPTKSRLQLSKAF